MRAEVRIAAETRVGSAAREVKVAVDDETHAEGTVSLIVPDSQYGEEDLVVDVESLRCAISQVLDARRRFARGALPG